MMGRSHNIVSWPDSWEVSSSKNYSACRTNGIVCGVFVMCNVYYITMGVERPIFTGNAIESLRLQLSKFLEKKILVN